VEGRRSGDASEGVTKLRDKYKAKVKARVEEETANRSPS
jgi:hypothetical protein